MKYEELDDVAREFAYKRYLYRAWHPGIGDGPADEAMLNIAISFEKALKKAGIKFQPFVFYYPQNKPTPDSLEELSEGGIEIGLQDCFVELSDDEYLIDYQKLCKALPIINQKGCPDELVSCFEKWNLSVEKLRGSHEGDSSKPLSYREVRNMKSRVNTMSRQLISGLLEARRSVASRLTTKDYFIEHEVQDLRFSKNGTVIASRLSS